MTLIRSLQPRVRLSLVPWSRPPTPMAHATARTVAWWTRKLLAMVLALSPASSRRLASSRWWSVSLGLRPSLMPLALAAVVGALHNALALVLGHSTQEGNEAPAQRGGQVQMRLV